MKNTAIPKNGPPGGGAFYQISAEVAQTTCIQLLLEMTPAIFPFGPIPTVFGFSTPEKGTLLMKTFLKRSFARFVSQKTAPSGAVLTHFTRSCTNYLHTTFIEMTPAIYPFRPILTFFGFSALIWPVLGYVSLLWASTAEHCCTPVCLTMAWKLQQNGFFPE